MNTNNRNVFCLSLILTVLVLMTGCAEDPVDTDPATRTLYRSVRAMGGIDRTSEWQTRVQKGIYMTNWPGWGNLKANTSRYIVKPDRVLIDNDFSAYDHPFFFTYYLNGDDAWQVVNLGVRQSPRTTERMKDYLKRADGLTYYLTHSDTVFPVTDVEPDSILRDVSFERVGCVTEGDTVLFDIDRESDLLIRQIEPKNSKQTVYEDYRKTGDIRVPYHVTIYREGEKAEEFIWETIEYNTRVDTSMFEENRP